jgi:hypothetical protein
MVKPRKMISPPLIELAGQTLSLEGIHVMMMTESPSIQGPEVLWEKCLAGWKAGAEASIRHLIENWAEVGTMGSPLRVGAGLILTHPIHHLAPIPLGGRRMPSSGYGKQKGRLPPTQLL